MDLSADSIVRDARKLALGVSTISSVELPKVFDTDIHVSQGSWREKSSTKPHALHGLASRVGGFPADLARYLILRYSKVGQLVCDPFCGKGTTLFEAIQLGRNAIGGDIAVDAVYITRAKLNQLSIAEVVNYLDKVPCNDANGGIEVPADVRLFYSSSTLAQMLSMRKYLLNDLDGRGKRKSLATFIFSVLLGLLHGHSKLSLSLPCNQAFAMSPNYVRRFVRDHGLKRPKRDVKECVLRRCLALLPFPELVGKGVAFNVSAQKCMKYLGRVGDPVDLIVTSPPYLNRQTYVKDSWLRLWFSGSSSSRSVDSLETSSIPKFIQQLRDVLPVLCNCLRPRGTIVLVCGKANIDIKGESRPIKIAELCLYALKQSSASRELSAETLIIDRLLMKRGSYFAVHHGLISKDGEEKRRRYGEDEILVLRKER